MTDIKLHANARTTPAVRAAFRLPSSCCWRPLKALGKAGYLRRAGHGLRQLGGRAAALAFSPIDRRGIQLAVVKAGGDQ